jgi:hypothetical protein
MHAEGRSNISPLRVAVEPPLFRPAKLPECISRTSSGLQGLGVIFCPCSKSLLAFQTSKNLTQSQLSGGGGTAEAAIDGANETIDGEPNIALVVVAREVPAGELALER